MLKEKAEKMLETMDDLCKEMLIDTFSSADTIENMSVENFETCQKMICLYTESKEFMAEFSEKIDKIDKLDEIEHKLDVLIARTERI